MAEIQENPYGPQQHPTQAQLAQPPPNGMPPPVATAMPFHQPQHPQVMAPPGIPVEMHNNGRHISIQHQKGVEHFLRIFFIPLHCS